MTEHEVLLRESGDRLAISMTVSLLLCELAGRNDQLLPELHAMLHDHVEIGLKEFADEEGESQNAARLMYSHASQAVDRIFIMAARLRYQRHKTPEGDR